MGPTTFPSLSLSPPSFSPPTLLGNSIIALEPSPRFAPSAAERRAAEMLLGKRPRPPMRRTTSMTQFSAEDLSLAASGEEAEEGSGQHLGSRLLRGRLRAPPPRNIQRRSLSDFFEDGSLVAAQFLMACGLCNRSLGPGLDTFIYRGEIAFCSQECRELRIKQEELKEKCLLTPMKSDAPSAVVASESTGNGETIVVA